MNDQQIARALGWFSIGLGLSEIAAPEKVGEAAGVDSRPELLRWFGVRELATGIGILARRRRGPWLWARVAGDLLDLAVLGTGFKGSSQQRRRAAMATAAVLGVTVLDLMTSRRLSSRRTAPFSARRYRGPAARFGSWPATRSAIANYGEEPEDYYP
jgi:hypothetical protein